MHLNTEELVDIAEGTRSEATAPHLAGCEPCRAQLRELRAMMAEAKDAGVPEPSPLFWDHLSARISDAIAANGGQPGRSSRWFAASEGGWAALLGAPAAQGIAIVAAGVLLAVTISQRAMAPAPAPPPPSMVWVSQPAPAVELLDDSAVGKDPSLTLVASLTDTLDLDEAREAGLAPRGSAEHAITHMSPGELRELGRLLKEEME